MDLTDKDDKNIGRQFESQKTTVILHDKGNRNELRQNYLIGMVESVSFGFKECIENIVLAINQSIQGNEIPIGEKAPIEQHGDIKILKEYFYGQEVP